MQINYQNAAPVEDERPGVFPAGWYKMVIDASKVKDTRSGTGKMLEIEASIVAGPHKGRKSWTNINYQNASAEAQRIGQNLLNALCASVGVQTGQLRDTNQLHSKPFAAKVAIEPGKDGYPDKNIIKWAEPVTRFDEVSSADASPASPPAEASGDAPKQVAPWLRKKAAA